jgi:hypothetical protein
MSDVDGVAATFYILCHVVFRVSLAIGEVDEGIPPRELFGGVVIE